MDAVVVVPVGQCQKVSGASGETVGERIGHGLGSGLLFNSAAQAFSTLSPGDQAAVDQFRAMLAAVRSSQPWTPGHAQDVAVRIGPFVERAHPAPATTTAPR